MDTPSSSPSLSPQKPFKLDEHQEIIFDRLNRLVSPGAAAFFKDACRHMVVEPPFTSTSHIVGHLLREIESALCDVLIVFSEDEKPKKNEPNAHERKIRMVLKALGIEEAEPIAQAWLDLTGQGNDKALYKRAHRDDLEQVRPVDSDYLEFWDKMQKTLDILLDRFESQYAETVFKKLDELVQKESPNAEDAKIIRSHIPNNFVARQRFFSQLENPKWLPFLKAEGIFLEPPEPEVNTEEKTTRHMPWPAGTYLEKVTVANSTLVFEILKEVKEVDNSNVKGNLLRTVCNLKKEDRIALLERIKGWVKTDHHFFQMGLMDPVKQTIEKFLEDESEDAAFEITATLLEILPDPTNLPPPKEGELYRPSLQPRSRIEGWYYGEFVKKEFPKLIATNEKRAFDLACDLLLSHRVFEHQNQTEDQHEFKDLSYIKRPAIEDHEQNHDVDDLEDILIDAVRDIGSSIVKKEPTRITGLYRELVAMKWTIFQRLAFFLLAQVPQADPDLLSRELTNDIFFDDNDVEHEHARLLREGFKFLSPETQKIILTWIEDSHHISESIKRVEERYNPEQAIAYKEMWQRDRLSYIKDDLSPELQKHYAELIEKHGEPDHPDLPSRSISWVGPESDIQAQDFLSMDTKALVQRLNDWKPPEGRIFGPSKEGVGRELASAIKNDHTRFNKDAELFKGSDPTFVRPLFQAFTEIVQNGGQIEWDPLLELSTWAVSQPVKIPGRKGEIGDEDPDWSWARKAAVSLLSQGMNRNIIPLSSREKLWVIIEPLTHDPDPTPEREQKSAEHSDDAYTFAINCTRGEAMGAVIEYALWIYRHLEKDPEKKKELSKGIEIAPEVKAILERNLDPAQEPSIAVRAMYGRFFPWLLLIDRDWVLKNLEKMLPPGQFDDRLYQAAWNTLMLYAPAYNDPFNVLKDRYIEAAKNLGKIDKEKRKRHTDRDERLAEHVVLFYSRGKIALEDPLVKEFFINASDELRGHALGFIGRSFKSDNQKIDPVILKRAQTLWEYRLKEAKEATNKENYEEEMASFGWWFASAKFEDKWSCEQYLKALEIGRKTQTDFFAIEQLGEVVKTLPVEAIKILEKLALADKPGWAVMSSRSETSSILRTALHAPEKEAREAARDLINRLVARGHIEFSDLLHEPEPPKE